MLHFKAGPLLDLRALSKGILQRITEMPFPPMGGLGLAGGEPFSETVTSEVPNILFLHFEWVIKHLC
jgi:hypothetical protein